MKECVKSAAMPLMQVLTVFFGSFIVGSFLTQFHQWLNNPASVVNLMGTAIPQTASFFLTYMALLAFLTTPVSGLSIIGLAMYWVKGKIASTERARARLWQDQFAQYGSEVSTVTGLLHSSVLCRTNPVFIAKL